MDNLNEFTPKSPDPSIITQADQGLAKFGHINIIVDYLTNRPIYANNAAAVAAGLQPGQLFVLTATKALTQVQ